MFNVTMRRVHANIVAVEKQEVFHILDRVFVALGIQHAKRLRHIVICRLPPHYNIFPHYLINGTMCVSIFYTTLVWNIFHSKKKWAKYYRKGTKVFTLNARYSYTILTRLEFSGIFEKCSHIKHYANPSSGSRVILCGETDGQAWWS